VIANELADVDHESNALGHANIVDRLPWNVTYVRWLAGFINPRVR
jgi:hypothetical protein